MNYKFKVVATFKLDGDIDKADEVHEKIFAAIEKAVNKLKPVPDKRGFRMKFTTDLRSRKTPYRTRDSML